MREHAIAAGVGGTAFALAAAVHVAIAFGLVPFSAGLLLHVLATQPHALHIFVRDRRRYGLYQALPL